MHLVGLPGETGIIWASGMLVNIYGALLAYIALSTELSLSYAQVSVLFTMILVAHTFPVELQIASKAGVNLRSMFLIRFLGAILLGILLNWGYESFNYLQETAVVSSFLSPSDPSILVWAINELKNYAIIAFVIFCLLLLLKIFEKLGFISIISRAIQPILGILGIKQEVIPIALIGLTLGLSYGGAIIIEESKNTKLSGRDIFYALTLMGLCHSMIEDTLLMFSFGGHVSGILFARIIFALIMTFVIVKITLRFSDKTFNKWFIRKGFRKE
jgi:spore maturation protein SpmB